MYRDNAGPEWRRAEMRQTGEGQWSAGIPLRSGATTLTEFFVQLVDGAGNVGVSTNKGGQFTTEQTDPGGEGIAFELTPAPPEDGFYRESPRITIAGLDKEEGAQVTVDDGKPFRYEGAFTVKGDGVHEIRARSDSGGTAVTFVAIDTTPPTVVGSVSPSANDAGWRKPPVTVSWTCSDGLSGVVSCPEPTTLRSDGAGQSASATVTDKAGNSTSAKVDGINIDATPPDTKVNNVLILAPGRPLTGSASDGLSGATKVTVAYRPILLGAPSTVEGTLTCDQARRSCTWSAPAPSTLGLYSVTATAVDAAGNPDPTPASVLLTISLG
jgi:hypothetical protein